MIEKERAALERGPKAIFPDYLATIQQPSPSRNNNTEAVRRIIAKFHLPRATAGTVAVLAGFGGAR